MRWLLGVIIFGVGMLRGVVEVVAAPYFYISGDAAVYSGTSFPYKLYFTTDGETVTSMQTVISYSTTYVDNVSIDASNTRCSFFAPADPGLGYGNASTPYFYNDEKVVVACGFSNPGYSSEISSGDLILTFNLTAAAAASASGTSHTVPLSFSNTQIYFAGTSIVPGASSGISLTVYQSQQASIPTPTPTSLPSADVLNEDSLNFVEIGSGITASSQTSSSLTTLSTITGAPQSAALTRDDSIPPPPDDLEPRAPVTPIPMAPTLSPEEEKQGDVLSVQSLRELLLPGKSNANQTVVVINLLSTLAFLVILTILILRMVAISRKNRVKARHMKELITGEISVLEGKFKTANEADSGYREELERLKEELEKV